MQEFSYKMNPIHQAKQQGKPAFPAEPASPNLQCYGLQLFTASSIILFLLFLHPIL